VQDSEQEQRNLIALSDTKSNQIQSTRRSEASEVETRPRSSNSEQNNISEYQKHLKKKRTPEVLTLSNSISEYQKLSTSSEVNTDDLKDQDYQKL
jgi:hypothetical protein